MATLAVAAAVSIFAWPHRHHPDAGAEALPSIEKVPKLRASLSHQAVAAPSSTSAAIAVPVEPGQTLREIEDAADSYSVSELPRFEKWLGSPNPVIRAEAADGLLRSGLPGGASLLRAAAASSRDPAEIATYQRSAAILDLPPATGSMGNAMPKSSDRQALPHYRSPLTRPTEAAEE